MRPFCSVCRYPQKTCVCSAVTQICTPVQFLIIQHEKEAIHAKNTAKLVQLCLPDTPILSAGADEAETAVADALNNAGSPAVIYPSPESTSLEKTPQSGTHDLFILLDGSWRQAYGCGNVLHNCTRSPSIISVMPARVITVSGTPVQNQDYLRLKLLPM